MSSILSQTFKLIRVHHWIKNLAVFLPVFFAGQALDVLNDYRIYDLIILFFSFCLTSSIIYVINDSVDIEKDKLHPTKSKRPLASGFFSKRDGFFIASLLVVADIFLLANLGLSKWFVLSYFVLNLAYSFKLKNIAVIDVSCISLGFLLRILAGGVATSIIVSHWMIIIVFLLSISIAFAKRRDDLIIKKDGEILRKAQEGYSLAFIDAAKGISFSVTLVCYIMYSVSPEVVERIGSDYVYTTSLFVFLGIIRYLQISIVRQNSGSPIKILTKDVFMQLIVLAWVALFSFLIYF
ncbi:UbiA prenyltransferase family protein [Winogradskyella sp. DF17]|uniref:UbiA prenyltransferase family protein n=1 Tax=Winogradskyella pelagia TaxID=2819984 RepID=A0ABS3T187_9FLAO|nr:UbiA prenyltransferase family protein [Winogradskyella sp. DF17]MBO3116510.1 UbiA prenyltransferase family protein [Winogradskyella sp. DF17]